MGISVSSPNIRKFKRYSLGKFQTDIQVSNVENLEEFFDYNSVSNVLEEKIHEIGARVSSISKSVLSDENISTISNNFTSAVNKVVSTAGNLVSTGAVISSSVVSGGAKLVEHVSDGLTWTAGKIVDGFFNVAAFGAGFFSKDAKESILETKNDFDSSVREHIARDQVGEFNQAFYENTKLGRIINKNSYIKYDSDAAKTIQNVTTTTVEIGLATAATVLTGGMAAPAAAAVVGTVGFMNSVGESAEKHYNAPEVSDNAEVDILLDGVVGAIEWYSYGKLGANAVGAAHAINQAGVEGVKTTVKATTMALKEEFANKGISGMAKTGVKSVVNKKNFLSALKLSLTDVDTYTDVSGVIARDLKRYYNGENIDLLDVGAKLGGVLIANIGLTTVSHGLLTRNEADEFVRLNNQSLQDEYVTQGDVLLKKVISTQELLEQSDFNKKNLVKGILEPMPSTLNEEERIRYIYLKLNQAVSYSDEYLSYQERFFRANNNILYNDIFFFENMEQSNIVCSNWSQLYKDLLTEAGIDSNRITIMGKEGSHKFIKIDMGNDNIIIADGMISGIGGYTDVVNAKLGLSTRGFTFTTQKKYDDLVKESGGHRAALREMNLDASYKDKKLINVDKSLGYDVNQLRNEYNYVVNSFSSKRNISVDDFNSFASFIDEKNMSAVDAYPVMRKLYNNFSIAGEVKMYYDGQSIIDVAPVIIDDRTIGYLYKKNSEPMAFIDDIDPIISGFKEH